MSNIALCVITVLAGWSLPAAAGELRVRTISPANLIDHQVIVGRAQCGGATWLLTDSPVLYRVSVEARSVSPSSIRGLRQSDKPWGLACLPENQLWLLAAHDALARVGPDGRVVERVRLERPRLGLFGTGDRLLLQQPPSGAGRPLLTAGLPGKLASFVQWPAPLAQHAPSRDEEVIANLVNCGLGAAGYVPCWLANRAVVSISDGSPSHTTSQELHFVRAGAIDEAVPIWDVALSGSSRTWVLASARNGADGRRAGGRLTRSNRRGADEGFVDLSPAARLILWAAEDRCVLLSSAGQLVEVGEP